jgi:hypothetical protein
MTDDERAGVEILGLAYREILNTKLEDARSWRYDAEGVAEASAKETLVAALVGLAKLQDRFDKLPLALEALARAHQQLTEDYPFRYECAEGAGSDLAAGLVRVGARRR